MNAPSPDRDAQLARRFVALADTLVDEYDVVDLLDELVHAVVELLPVEHAGLLLRDEDGNPQLLASTSETSRILELYQLQSSEGGPCLECLQSGAPVLIDDLAANAQKWPEFARTAQALGFEAVHALPLRLRRDAIGALNLFGPRAHLSDADLQVGQSLADMATIGILQQRSARRAAVEAEQLKRALDTRVVIEQAKGVLSEFGSVGMDVAFEQLRRYARSRNSKLGEVADSVVRREISPEEITPAKDRH